jgi:hypothetical protein
MGRVTDLESCSFLCNKQVIVATDFNYKPAQWHYNLDQSKLPVFSLVEFLLLEHKCGHVSIMS